MVSVWTDFNAETPDGVCWLLMHAGEDLESQMSRLGLKNGDIVTLTQDGDFSVRATLETRFVEMLGRTALVAVPDWTSLRYFDGCPEDLGDSGTA